MKKLFFIGLLISIVLISGCTENQSPKDRLTEYTNTEFGIKMKYPVGWIENKNSAGNGVGFSNENSLIAFIVQEVVDKEEFDSQYLRGLEGQEGFYLVYYGNTTLSGSPAKELVFERTKNGNLYKSNHIWTVKSNKAYVFIYLAPSEAYGDNYFSVVEKVIQSFEIL